MDGTRIHYQAGWLITSNRVLLFRTFFSSTVEFGVDISRISELLVLCQNPFRKPRLESEAFVSSPCEDASNLCYWVAY